MVQLSDELLRRLDEEATRRGVSRSGRRLSGGSPRRPSELRSTASWRLIGQSRPLRLTRGATSPLPVTSQHGRPCSGSTPKRPRPGSIRGDSWRGVVVRAPGSRSPPVCRAHPVRSCTGPQSGARGAGDTDDSQHRDGGRARTGRRHAGRMRALARQRHVDQDGRLYGADHGAPSGCSRAGVRGVALRDRLLTCCSAHGSAPARRRIARVRA